MKCDRRPKRRLAVIEAVIRGSFIRVSLQGSRIDFHDLIFRNLPPRYRIGARRFWLACADQDF
jgi:hypothetical protein